MPAGSVPDRGDVVWISLNPQAGHEQAGQGGYADAGAVDAEEVPPGD